MDYAVFDKKCLLPDFETSTEIVTHVRDNETRQQIISG